MNLRKTFETAANIGPRAYAVVRKPVLSRRPYPEKRLSVNPDLFKWTKVLCVAVLFALAFLWPNETNCEAAEKAEKVIIEK